jgi:biotin carboxylase
MRSANGEDAIDASGKAASPDRIILVVCPTHRDYRELPRLSSPGISYIFHDYASTSLEDLVSNPDRAKDLAADPLDEIEAILAKARGLKLAGVITSDDYPGSALAAAVAQRLGLPGPDPAVVLLCQHKYLARVAQAKHVPQAVPSFALIDVAGDVLVPDGLRFPLFVKPVKSFFSIGAERVNSAAELAALLPHWNNLDQFFQPLERMLEHYTGATIGTKRLIAEGLLKGEQVTVEGYVHGGVATIFGVVDSIMFPGTLAFSRFDYPSHLPPGVQRRMGEIAATTMQGLGFDNGIFNIEIMYDAEPDRISIIEINPRMASQFADLYEKVDGTNSFSVLLDIAQGRTPRFTRRQGRFEFAASCVLRSFHDSVLVAVPSEADITRLAGIYPDIRVELHATPGRKLSDEFQDGKSYRYGVLNLGGRDLADVLEQFESCRAQLGIELLSIETSQDARADLPRESMAPAHNASGGERPPSAASDEIAALPASCPSNSSRSSRKRTTRGYRRRGTTGCRIADPS